MYENEMLSKYVTLLLNVEQFKLTTTNHFLLDKILCNFAYFFIWIYTISMTYIWFIRSSIDTEITKKQRITIEAEILKQIWIEKLTDTWDIDINFFYVKLCVIFMLQCVSNTVYLRETNKIWNHTTVKTLRVR
jgi:hypothetical protein